MAGHSQFKNIMYRKGAQDAKRAKIFAKLSREVTVAARHGMDPDMNSALRNAIQAARAQNMPKDNIERAIKRSQAADGENFEENRYEGFGPGGVSVIVETLTDNRNRTVSDVRTVFSRHGGSLGESGSVSYLFDRVGQIRFPAACADADTMLEAVIEHGGDDCSSDDDEHEVLCAADDLNEISSALQEQFGPADSVRLIWKPQTAIALDEEKAGTMLKMLDALEDNDDVQHVFANFEIDDEVLAKLSE